MKRYFLVAVLIGAALLFISCSSTEAIDLVDQLRVEQDQKMDALSSQIGENEKMIADLETELSQLERGVSDLETALVGLQKEFEFTYNTLNEFVSYAGYESSEDFLTLGRDIVNVNAKIKEFNARIDSIQELMRSFLEE